MAAEPQINPHYTKVKTQADAWITRVMKKDEAWAARNASVDLAFLASCWAPGAGDEGLRVVVDWNHWVFLFDDRRRNDPGFGTGLMRAEFDEGHLRNDLAAARREINMMLAVMDGLLRVQEEDAVRFVFQTVCDRVGKQSSLDLQKCWKTMHQRYFDGLLQQVEDTQAQLSHTRSIQQYMDMRAHTIGVYPAIALALYAAGVDLPERVLQHPCLQECMRISAELVTLVNDIASFQKDLMLNVELNIIILVRRNGKGINTQKAVDEIGVMIKACYQRWHHALAGMPTWGEKIDREVCNFVDLQDGPVSWRPRNGSADNA
ncbi:isoprenoid synthase domain-containing protein [Lasiosphaeria hispida]|uniref:Terpene synthase n=1 Tax=Lasiosphaeria hispida TaxID=260671 RepID=A0AAJ0HKI4_9PEZI|nr:isoprenoid synthase domain-containing protein [Lasiosphaeria hispida]